MTKDDTTNEISPLEQKVFDLEAELVIAQELAEKEKSKALLALADLQNFQRREQENKANWGTMAVCDFWKKNTKSLLELQLASSHTEDEAVKSVIEKYLEALSASGLSVIAPEAGTLVDTDLHEVLMAAEGKPGTVVQVLEPGWKYNETTLVPAKVSAAPQA